MDRSGEPRIWICPVSTARFEADSDDQAAQKKVDKYGRPTSSFTVTQIDGVGG